MTVTRRRIYAESFLSPRPWELDRLRLLNFSFYLMNIIYYYCPLYDLTIYDTSLCCIIPDNCIYTYKDYS